MRISNLLLNNLDGLVELKVGLLTWLVGSQLGFVVCSLLLLLLVFRFLKRLSGLIIFFSPVATAQEQSGLGRARYVGKNQSHILRNSQH